MLSAAATKVDAVVIGAGVLGLAVTRALAQQTGSEVLLLERTGSIGSETSSRNSEVIHAGLYYPKDSFKARFCVRGRHLLYEYCQSRAIETHRYGKLVVATTKEQAATTLPALLAQARANGVDDVVQLQSPDDVRVMEPNLTTTHGALWSPSTGIVDSHAFMTSLLADAEQDGATLALHTTVDNARILHCEHHDPYHIQLDAGGMQLSCRKVVNCAGLWADGIARKLHAQQHKVYTPPRHYYCKGTYFALDTTQKTPFSQLIYPVPDPQGGLGVHATLDASGRVRFGPDVEWWNADTWEPAAIPLAPDPARAQAFYKAIRSYWPELPDNALVPDYAGVRPKLQHPQVATARGESMTFQDFCLAGPKEHGVRGLYHLLGMESPGLTSALAIAEFLSSEIKHEFR